MRTKLSEHRRKKKKLIPPLADLPNLSHCSWVDDRLPEMLWAALIVSAFPRAQALRRFVNVIDAAVTITEELDTNLQKGPLIVTMSGIATLSLDHRAALLAAMTPDEESRDALRPMLLLGAIPALESWRLALGSEATEEDGFKLAPAIGNCYLHQSQAATDCRWVKVAYAVLSGRIQFMAGTEESGQLILGYPNHDEETLRISRPTVRSMEAGFAGEWDSGKWASEFWKECLMRSDCQPPEFDKEAWEAGLPSREQMIGDRKRLQAINQKLSNHFWNTCTTTGYDPRHEVSFGIALYAAELVTAAIAMGMGFAPQGRMTLRALVECLVTLKYLGTKDAPEQWATFRAHGQGQAKLVHQRSDETGRLPVYLDKNELDQIANDDTWVEFLPVQIGHWDASDLRKMAESVGLKDVYDDYYTWPSGYTHGQWGAIRESVLTLCHNPLHRFHRIPSLVSVALPDCRNDCFLLLDQIIAELLELYPEAQDNLQVAGQEAVKAPE